MDGLATQCGMVRGAGDPLTALLNYVSAEGLNANFAIYDLRNLAGSTVSPSGGLTTSTMSLIGSPTLGIDGVTFNGSNQYGEINNSSFWVNDRFDPHTLFARATPASTSNGCLIAKQDDVIHQFRGIYLFRILGQGIWNGMQNKSLDFINSKTSSLNTTDQTYIGTYDGSGSNSGLKIYEDGVDATSLLEGTLTSTVSTNAKFRIAARGLNSTNLHFAGKITAVGMFDVELTSAQASVVSSYLNAL